MSKLKVGINGFGRIGRVLLRAGFDQIDIAGINCVGDPKTYAHLLKYDSSHGAFNKDVSVGEGCLIIDGKRIPVSSTYKPEEIPWSDWGVDVVLECTGAFNKREQVLKHIEVGAKKVIVSAPFSEADLTLVYGVNHTQYNHGKHHVISNASCTTNCLAPLAKVLQEEFGIHYGMMTTIHSYTNDQKVLDTPHKDLRRARTAAVNMIPTTTGAAKAVGLVLPELAGKVDGFAIRVPTPNVSLVDFTFESVKAISKESINAAIKKSADSSLKGVLSYTNEPLVSSDFMSDVHSSVVDLDLTMAVSDKMGKVISWYDNEMGFSRRMIDIVKYMQSQGL